MQKNFKAEKLGFLFNTSIKLSIDGDYINIIKVLKLYTKGWPSEEAIFNRLLDIHSIRVNGFQNTAHHTPG